MLKARNLYILKSTEDFVRGEMDNVALDENALCLEQMAGGYVLYGCYTSPVISFPPFTQMAVSWNAETPEGTVVEAQCRVMAGEEWTGWLSLGKWSPFIDRAGQTDCREETVRLENGVLSTVNCKATRAQLRIYLYTESERLTPSVRLLGASVLPAERQEGESRPYGRLLRLPAYSQQVRHPALKEYMDGPVALTSLLNRYGLDILPEELTLTMFDRAAGSCKNQGFAVAAAGCYGYEAYLAYLDRSAVWEHIKAGDSVALEVSYSAESDDPSGAEYPLLPGSFSGGSHQLMPLRGFELTGEGQLLALVNDSHAPTDKEAETSYPADALWQVSTGLALIVSGFHKNQQEGSSPLRRHAQLRALTQVGCYAFQTPEGEDIPIPEDFGGCLCAALSDGTAWATTAHKNFVYLEKGPEGSVQLPHELLAPGAKITLYAIWPSGSGLVGQLNL